MISVQITDPQIVGFLREIFSGSTKIQIKIITNKIQLTNNDFTGGFKELRIPSTKQQR